MPRGERGDAFWPTCGGTNTRCWCGGLRAEAEVEAVGAGGGDIGGRWFGFGGVRWMAVFGCDEVAWDDVQFS